MTSSSFPVPGDQSILLTGVTGFIGRELLPLLLATGYQCWVLTRHPPRSAGHRELFYFSDFEHLPEQLPASVINLAGEGIADRRWTGARKHQLTDSRVGVTDSLLRAYRDRNQSITRLLSGSAVGVYGCRKDSIPQAEHMLLPGVLPHGHEEEFGARLCAAWEQSALAAVTGGSEVCLLRIGPVLASDGGMIARLRLPFLLGMGGPIGSGTQWLSWIHRQDLCRAILFLLQAEHLPGCVNLVAPAAVTNLEFARALGKAWRRPAFMPLPGLAVRLLWGQMGTELLLGGQRVVPEVLQQAGFEFDFPQVTDALRSL
ncbi:TIGR01777 family oxidoreductase [Pseudomaricurvus sp. HS19]|uniref:TIGR01777 family oxidoreductase n=1 Tax=Pseudomaricurvus sp. HS19 TaxID=2692626 RepID=UPI00136D79D5|nr:TIGR01777 family oxidoreductase [Pseudomaricurvus sp. HS19]MYM62313.1 TIGR01777 family protein [Pseudomaricurvus sp. HS19]